ncbi:MAG: class I SAM-dependent methyltransferase [Candidatus Nanopelagicaceae bacterium]
MANPFIPGRGKDYCRGCNHPELFSALDLGDLPIANELWQQESEVIEKFPLHLRICRRCGLGQVEDVVTPSRLFRDYRYLSSMSASFIEHARVYATEIASILKFKDEEWVLEIASNDGYLLQHFIDLGIHVLGIEPAENVAKVAIEKGIPTESEFFGLAFAASLLERSGYPRLIVANNVMAHVPDIRDFISGLAKMAGPNTLISIENPSLMNFLEGNQFDTIYHEHYSYLTAHSVKVIAAEFGLELFEVEKINTHGGSNRYWLRLQEPVVQSNGQVESSISGEIDFGLFNVEAWGSFAARVESTIHSFHDWLSHAHQEGRTVYGFGAAAKASTLINASRIEKDWIIGIADTSHEKQGRFMPVQGIPIISPEKMYEMNPTDIIIFPWNIKNELVPLIRRKSAGNIRMWQVIPTLEMIS